MTTPPAFAPLLDALVALAAEAGAAEMAIYAGDPCARAKSDGSPVTAADMAGEKAILAGLARLAPGVPVVSEEAASEGVVPPPSRLFFMVDPLDGTKEFLAHNGEFTVNIALIDEGAPILGVVAAPALDRVWFGAAGLGAWRREGAGAPTPIHVRPAPARLSAIASRSHCGPATTRWLERFDVAECVSAGSSLKLCRLAEGAADIYPRLGRTMEWDIAAGDAILRAAGGRLTRLDGSPFVYGERGRAGEADFANPDFVAWGDPALLEASRGRL